MTTDTKEYRLCGLDHISASVRELIPTIVASHNGIQSVPFGKSLRDEQYQIVLNWDGNNCLRGFDLAKRDLSNLNLTKADLGGANLWRVSLARTNLARAILEGAILERPS